MGREVWIYQLEYAKVEQGMKQNQVYMSALKSRPDLVRNGGRESENSALIKTTEELWHLLEDISLLENCKDQRDFPEWGIHLLFESQTKSAANSFLYQFYTFIDEMKLVPPFYSRDHYGSVLDVDTFLQFLEYLIVLCQKAGTLPLELLPLECTPPSEKINKIISQYDDQDPFIQLITRQLENIQRAYDTDPQPASLPPELDLVIRKDWMIECCLDMQKMVSDSLSNIFILDSV